MESGERPGGCGDGHEGSEDGSNGHPPNGNGLDEDARPPDHDCAYVSLLYGSSDHFFLFALVAGHCLRTLCPGADRVLLCAGRWWRDRAARAALQRVFSHVQHVRLIHAPQATMAPRHEYVFSKIKALRLPYCKLVFLDLDLVLRRDLSPLFEVPAPAGLHHGDCQNGDELVHAQLIAKDKDHKWCINAGVMRLDPLPSHQERRDYVDAMVAEIKSLEVKSYLPEQYYLADRLEGWRHLSAAWNMEVGPTYMDPGLTWPRERARQAAWTWRSQHWRDQAVDEVHVFHFSGTQIQPWWYADLSPDEAYHDAKAQWFHRDPKRLVATAVFEWRSALERVEHESASWSREETQAVAAVTTRVRERAAAIRQCRYNTRGSAWSPRALLCDRCKHWRPQELGRWLLGWEGWWLCEDCIVGYVFADEEAPAAPACIDCGSAGHHGGDWDWRSGRPRWRCGYCWYCKGKW